MIKRPFLWILSAYLAGMLFAWNRFAIVFLSFVILIFYIILWYLMYRSKCKRVNRQDYFLWFLPVLLILGFLGMGLQMKSPELETKFDASASCKLTGEVTMIVEKKNTRVLYLKNNAIYLSGSGPYQCENVIVYCSDKQEYLTGNIITVYGEIQKFSRASNPGQFNEKLYYQIQNIDYKVMAEQCFIVNPHYSKYHAALSYFKKKLVKLYSRLLSDKESGTLMAMLLGEKQLLDDEISNLYKENGISHILAISGLHVSMIGIFIYKLLKKLKASVTMSTIISIFFIYSYGILTNFSVSTNRAVVMLIVMMLSKIFGKTYDTLSALSLSALIILLKSPMQIFDAGFLLSFGAVLSLAVIYPSLLKLFPTKNPILKSIYVSSSAQVLTLPIVLYFYYQLPSYSILINLLILPFASILVLTALIAGVLGICFFPLGVFLIGGANYILKMYEMICKIGSSLPGNLITIGKPDIIRIFLYFVLIILFIYITKRFEKKVAFFIIPAALLILIFPQKIHGLEVTMMDIGQGDSIFMKTESNSTYLIDGGSSDRMKAGTYIITPFLLSEGVDTLDYVIISHTDSDHISGIKELIEGTKIKIENLILPELASPDNSYQELIQLAENKKIKVYLMKAGDEIEDGKVILTCLHPPKEYCADSANGYSAVLSLTYKDFDMLFTGDADSKGEAIFLDQLKDYDVLKVAHHGSNGSTSKEFLDIVKPEYALISCGLNNRYGHPHQELLERLSEINATTYITSRKGAVSIRTDGKRMEITSYLP